MPKVPLDEEPRIPVSEYRKNQRIKVMHILNSFNTGGLENGVVNLINRMNDQRFYHEICCVRHSGNASRRLSRKIPIFELNKAEGNDWRIVGKLIDIIKKSRPDVVHTRNWGAVDGVIAARLAGVRHVIHGEHGWNMDDPEGRNRKRLLARRLLSMWVDQFVAVSQDIGSWLKESVKISPRKIKTIINGVDTRKFLPKKEARLTDGIVIGIIGRLDPIKRHDLLLRAFSKLDHANCNLRLLVVGGGPERCNLERLKESLPSCEKVVFLGERADVESLYKAIDIFVLPSQNEGISNTILEAMSSGLPIIATHVGGNPELVTHGKTGLLIRPRSADEIRDALNYYIHQPDKIQIHGRSARADAECRFSLDRMVEAYEHLYFSLNRIRPHFSNNSH